ncbi:hypothetical protein [Motilimonas pumila]|uniref:Uncharacterized protein n=1 Tax=Motilimonas pumila TaxID=2303987 RepID=A0A418YHV4_9GAMM|nr:hypothetical protein [Motilimonas pumila]RJG49953.1 hypothetical protein D1Z90_04730 [Motilimonas pumila]
MNQLLKLSCLFAILAPSAHAMDADFQPQAVSKRQISIDVVAYESEVRNTAGKIALSPQVSLSLIKQVIENK